MCSRDSMGDAGRAVAPSPSSRLALPRLDEASAVALTQTHDDEALDVLGRGWRAACEALAGARYDEAARTAQHVLVHMRPCAKAAGDMCKLLAVCERVRGGPSEAVLAHVRAAVSHYALVPRATMDVHADYADLLLLAAEVEFDAHSQDELIQNYGKALMHYRLEFGAGAELLPEFAFAVFCAARVYFRGRQWALARKWLAHARDLWSRARHVDCRTSIAQMALGHAGVPRDRADYVQLWREARLPLPIPLLHPVKVQHSPECALHACPDVFDASADTVDAAGCGSAFAPPARMCACAMRQGAAWLLDTEAALVASGATAELRRFSSALLGDANTPPTPSRSGVADQGAAAAPGDEESLRRSFMLECEAMLALVTRYEREEREFAHSFHAMQQRAERMQT